MVDTSQSVSSAVGTSSDRGCGTSKFAVSFINLSYSCNSKSGKWFRKSKENSKLILDSIAGNLKPGLNAIMGPSGSGKSTLLNILSGRLKDEGLSGLVYYNGLKRPKNIFGILGYVTQKDCIMGTLTVKENLWFSANLRLPSSLTKEEKDFKVREVISLLSLEDCQDSKIGTDLVRGVSGGERRRVAIGMELILQPSILFLDEPTSGLDASTAQAVMILLKRLSHQGMNVVFSIHQPRFSIFRLFDTLTLLGKGKLIFHAPVQYTLLYFKSLGYVCNTEDNPADFLQDIISGDADIEMGNLVAEDGLSTLDQLNVVIDHLAQEFKSSSIYANLKFEIQDGVRVGGQANLANLFPYIPPPAPLSVLYILSQRALKNLLRNPIALTSSTILNLLIGVIFGLFYFQLDNSASSGVQNRLGFLFFVCSNMLFGSFGAIELFAKEHEMFMHEFKSGNYKVWQYFLAKLFADLIPLRTICPLLFCCITYWMVGLKPDAGAFFIFILSVLMLVYSATGIGIFYSASFKNFATSSICISLTFVFAILFDGFLVNVNTILPWLRWLRYFSISRYGFTSLCINELRHQKFLLCDSPFIADETPTSVSESSTFPAKFEEEGSFSGNDSCSWLAGEDILLLLSVPVVDDRLTNWALWQNIIALACFAAISFLLSYLQLLRRARQ